MITTDRMDELMVAITLGKKVEAKNDEEKAWIRKIRKQISEAKKQGYEIRIPPS